MAATKQIVVKTVNGFTENTKDSPLGFEDRTGNAPIKCAGLFYAPKADMY